MSASGASLIRRIVAGAGVVGLVGGLLLATGATAQASTPLTVSSGCHGMGGPWTECLAYASGGVAPYTYTWNLGGIGNDVAFHCPLPTAAVVTVRDAAGSTVTQSAGGDCASRF